MLDIASLVSFNGLDITSNMPSTNVFEINGR